ncbi:restriction endonuclease subunit S [Aeromonas sp.]|uniref:restriction endonuclease subunit S n=1 Tax=Aeromonas sp. TaxID=647 RepID=UPI0025909726|nr:restriction endonuclease subunit S [Aeromonas sp.]MCX7132189.1 restriction endonuclease subunit S [Aeromonas sp.]
MTLTAMPKYETYKDSGVEWIGDIPTEWDVLPIKRVLKLISEKVSSSKSDLQYIGLENIESWSGKIIDVAQDVEGLANEFFPQDILFGKLRPYLAKVALAVTHGICSTELLVYRSIIGQPAYFKYLLSSQQFIELVNSSTYGSKMPRASADFIGVQRIPIPAKVERTSISDFLDKKIAKIDEAIAIKEKQIALLNEHKQIQVQQAVTRGLDPTVPMKNSGVAWIGKIPEHWQVKRLKFVLDERSERSLTGEEPLFMVSQQYGLVVRADYHEKAVVAASNIDSKIVYKNDLVFNKLKAHLGVFFKSNIDFKGIVSPDYAVYKIKDYISDTKILELLFRNPLYIEQFTIRATGIVEGLIRLYTSDLFDISIPIAPKEEQLEILSHIEKMSALFDKAIEIHRDQCEKLKEYKTTLINSAVTGKIKVV